MRLYGRRFKRLASRVFVQNEGLAHELAARFYAGRLRDHRNAYLRNAR